MRCWVLGSGHVAAVQFELPPRHPCLRPAPLLVLQPGPAAFLRPAVEVGIWPGPPARPAPRPKFRPFPARPTVQYRAGPCRNQHTAGEGPRPGCLLRLCKTVRGGGAPRHPTGRTGNTVLAPRRLGPLHCGADGDSFTRFSPWPNLHLHHLRPGIIDSVVIFKSTAGV